MTDPDRLSRRASGLAAELLRAAVEEQPTDAGMQQTLLALGVSGVLLSSTSAAAVVGAKLMGAGAAGAAGAGTAGAGAVGVGAAGVGLTSAGSITPLSVIVVLKWLGMGVVGGLSLAGVAAVATKPSAPSARPVVVARATDAPPQAKQAATAPRKSESQPAVVQEPAPNLTVSATPRAVVGRVELPAAEPVLDVGIPLATEVAYVDHARALLVAGQSSEGLALLDHYEQKFPGARLLPEVLFLKLEACERSGRSAEARSAAQRLVEGFPKSPHAGRARKLLEQ
jgi:hypothetical protein